MLCKATHCMSLFLGPEDQDFVILLIGVIRASSRRCDYLHMLTVHILPRCKKWQCHSFLLFVSLLYTSCWSGHCTSESRYCMFWFTSSCFSLVSLLVDWSQLPPLYSGTDVNAVDLRGVTLLHLALSRLRVIGGSEGEDSPEGIPLTRKKEITVIVCSRC